MYASTSVLWKGLRLSRLKLNIQYALFEIPTTLLTLVRKHGTPCHMASLCLFWLEKFTPYHEILGKDEIVTWTHIEKEQKIHDREILYNYFGFLNRLIKALLEKTDFYFWMITTKCPYNRNTLFGTFHQAKLQNLNMLETQIAYLYSWILYSFAYFLTFII